jgi:glycosyltransferase involved in cell wall biosynthesis
MSIVSVLPPTLRSLRVAFAHDWLITWRGGEKVLAAMAELFPSAPIFTLFHEKGAMSPALEAHRIETSWLDRLPLLRERHRHALPLMPLAMRGLELPEVDLVISSSHCVAKAVPVPEGARHLSYVHAPLRYMWDRFPDYFGPGKASLPVRLAARLIRPSFQAWDVATSKGVDRFVANSKHVAHQISQRYHRSARVVHPPVELERFVSQPIEGTGRGAYFLWVGALAPYKRVDLAIEAFRRAGLPLWIVGSGQSSQWLRNLPPNVKALGQVPDEDLPRLYREARALVFPGVEDFGITPLEAQASGRPVIALAEGGALETVTPQTGLFFPEPSVGALEHALGRFDAFERHFVPARARAWAQRFGLEAFQDAIVEELSLVMAGEEPSPRG